MKKSHRFLSVLLIGCVLCLSCFINGTGMEASAAQIGFVDATNVFIRKEPSTSSAVLAQVSHVTVTVNGYKKGTAAGDTHTWYNITYGDIVGYIRDDLITLQTITTDQTFEQQIKVFPESYAASLRFLHTLYPNWKFVATPLTITFEEAIELESTRKLVEGDAISWRSMGLGAYDWGAGKYILHDARWYVASREVLRYYMDPRNFLNENDIYMFMQLSYDPTAQTEAGLEAIVKNTFLAKKFDANDTVYGGSYIKLIMKAAEQSKVNPYVLASKIIQEQGTKGTSALISGKYPGYEGYYNFFNVQASGNSENEKYQNGLQYAKNQDWSSIPKAILGGASFCANSYITQGQDTYFKMDFNIQNPGRIWHEYAGAVHDALNCGRKIAGNYAGISDASLTFHIPVYKNIPSQACSLPAKSNRCNNYYFNLIESEGLTPSFSRYTYSYDLRVADRRAVKVTVPSGASYASADSFSLNTGQNKVVLKVKSESGYTTDYVLNVKADKACTLYIDHGQGVSVPVTTTTPTPTITRGDTNGDGKITAIDLAAVQKHLLNLKKLTGDSSKAADTNGDGNITVIDLAAIQKHLLGLKKLI